jgi:hypothetical protein
MAEAAHQTAYDPRTRLKGGGKPMTRLTSLIAGSLLGIAAAFAASFEPYPGAKLDEGLTRESNRIAAQAGGQCGTSQIWTTSASFELAFYQKTDAKEFVMRTPFSTGPHEETLPPQGALHANGNSGTGEKPCGR